MDFLWHCWKGLANSCLIFFNFFRSPKNFLQLSKKLITPLESAAFGSAQTIHRLGFSGIHILYASFPAGTYVAFSLWHAVELAGLLFSLALVMDIQQTHIHSIQVRG